MRFTSYSRYTGQQADALNLQALLDQLSDFLLQSGFAGGSNHHHPYWGDFGGDDADRSLDALKEALLRALMESGQLTREMIDELRGRGEPNEAVRRQIAELLDRLVERLVEEGYLNLTAPPQMPGGHQPVPGPGRVDDARSAAEQVEFNLTDKGIDFLGYRTLKDLLGALGKSSFGAHETPHLSTGIEAEAASRPYEFGDTLNLDIPRTLNSALARGGLSDDGTLDLDYGDLHVHQAEYRSSCATVLLLDTSHSMILYGEDRFTPAKKVALALTHLIRTQFPGDTLRVVLFGDRAEQIPLSRLAHAQVGPFHTNTADGLKLARRLLLAQNKDMRQIVMITDGKP
ncbi:MAG TPA: VWA domain-containing protein, partial [Longimicrobiaceae bacterium]|nr:VWA domain-containing protein [Longimicrobiaceae bacterium]